MNSSDNSASDSVSLMAIGRSIFMGVVTLLIILSNLINVIVLPRIRQLYKTERIFLINLSFADLSVGVIVCIPGLMASVNTNIWLLGPLACQISGVLHGTAASVSIWSLAVISSSRYLAIVHPIKYRKLTPKKCIVIVFILWFLLTVTFVIPIFIKRGFYYQYDPNTGICGLYWEYRLFCIVTGFVIPIGAGIVLLFTSISSVRHMRKRAHLRVTNKKRRRKKSKQRSALKLVAVTTSLYFIMWGPFVASVMAKAFDPSIITPAWADFTAMWLSIANSFINVIIYSVLCQPFRRRVKDMVTGTNVCGKNNDESYDFQLIDSIAVEPVIGINIELVAKGALPRKAKRKVVLHH